MKIFFNINLNSKGFSLLELLIVIFTSWTFVTFAIQDKHPRPSRSEVYLSECIHNQAVLQNALNSYDMDNTDMLDTAFPGEEFEASQKLLVQKHYLKEYITPRNKFCSYGFVDYCGSGDVFCKIHGSLLLPRNNDEPIYPEVASLSEKPYCEYYKNLKVEMKNESQIVRNSIGNKFSLVKFLANPLIPFIFLVITFVYCAFDMIKSKKQS